MTRRIFFLGAVGVATLGCGLALFFHSSAGSARPPAPAEAKAKYDASVERDEGLIAATFTTPEGGKLQVRLPAVGRKVSGTVVALSEAQTPAEGTERTRKLSGLVVAWENQKVTVEEKKKSFAWEVPAGLSGFFLMQLLDENGRKLAQTRVYVPEQPRNGQPPANFDLPRFVVAGDRVVLRGPFNGNVEDTQVTWNNATASLIAESEVLAVTEPLPGPNGAGRLEVSDAGKSAVQDAVKLQLELASNAGRTILKGATADLNVAVKGCQGMNEKDELGLRVQINSQNIRWTDTPGAVFYTKFRKADTTDGVYRKQLRFMGEQAGPYEIEATLSLFPDTHGDFTSKEEEHSWEKSSLPRHEAKDSGKNPHRDEITKMNKGNAHTPEVSARPRHEADVSSRVISQKYPPKSRQPVHHGEALSKRPVHTKELSDYKVHSPALTKSEQPAHDPAISNRNRHEKEWSTSEVKKRP